MFLIIGLGNPGKEYEHTRHNAGFDVLDLLTEDENLKFDTKKFQSKICDAVIEGKRVLLVKPQTYMNLSGNAVREIVNFYNLSAKDILVVSDDIALDVGKIRIRDKGSAGGHNGLKNIIENLSSSDFSRIRVGVGGNKDSEDLKNHVLSKVSKGNEREYKMALENAKSAIYDILIHGISYSMNKYNGMDTKEK